MKRLITSLAICAMLIFSTLQIACSQSQINRTLAALQALPPFVTAFHLAPAIEGRILQGLSEGTAAFITFRDNPTRGNLRNALAVFDDLVARGVFKTGNPSVDSRLGPAIAIVIFIMNTISPPTSVTANAGSDDAKVKITDDEKTIINAKLDELELMIKH